MTPKIICTLRPFTPLFPPPNPNNNNVTTNNKQANMMDQWELKIRRIKRISYHRFKVSNYLRANG